jgi:hypothetical protein
LTSPQNGAEEFDVCEYNIDVALALRAIDQSGLPFNILSCKNDQKSNSEIKAKVRTYEL